jgi:hypothetical protein
VTLEALLTFIAILVAILAVVRPVQRHSLILFVPMGWLGAAIFLSFFLIICRDAPLGMSPPFGWSLPVVVFCLTIAAFLIPIAAAVWSWLCWHQARLTAKRIKCVENVFQAALREREFDEVERILRKNQQALERLPANAASVLFDPAMVTALVGSHSLVHLELLANMPFLESLENRHGAVDVVVRELLRAGVSPIRSAVVSKYGGLEHLAYPDVERELIERTFQNPEWYFDAGAHYPLTISAVEALRSGKLDTVYNDVGRDYEASQGISTRSRCPIYLAIKTEVLAIQAALERRAEKDFYVTDLFDIFRAVQERSKFDKTVWQSSLSNSEFPTPYAYLLYEIASDLESLSANALKKATAKGAPPLANGPGDVARSLVLTWSFCVWNIADSQGQVSPEFRNHVIQRYLLFILALDRQPSEIYSGPVGGTVEGIHVWRDLFVSELRRHFSSDDSPRKLALKSAMESLDQGKLFVMKGYDWLNEKLFGHPQTI